MIIKNGKINEFLEEKSISTTITSDILSNGDLNNLQNDNINDFKNWYVEPSRAFKKT